ncbi:glycosyltransferase domain-containing protein [Paucibacter sp. B51]|uniref:glycosyltransferase domain-containing protein n=1 Tax=Paucibacter sp. B51 TaxID=2993315 RepID=UPI0022EBDC82|nr:glycosyltransferase domain-containing protein [Paucibacter sp. B51]
MTTPQARRPRLVIYTVLTGSKEPLGDPLAELERARDDTDLDIGFVCFTDNRALRSPVWEFRYLDDTPLPPEKLSRRPKALPHEYLPDWEYSLYVDNIVRFKRMPRAADLQCASPYAFRTFRHTTRSNPRQEAEAIVQLGYESVDRLSAQLDFYATRMPLSDITPLSTCTVILRQHMHPVLVKFGVIWWEQILNFCKRDQMSFDFAIHCAQAQIDYLPGLKHDNDLIQNSANIQPNRVHANFDAVRYAWMHRQDPAARANPRQHYLDHGRFEGRSYNARLELFEYLCYQAGSSLGAQVAPRRQVAATLNDWLTPWRGKPGRLLLVSITGAEPAAFEAEERARAEAALCAFLPGCVGTRIELRAEQLAGGELAFRPDDGGFDLIVVLGASGRLLKPLLSLVAGAFKPQGQMLVLASESAPLADVAALESAIALKTGSPCRARVQGSRHDSLDAGLPNSLLGFEWGP